MQKIITITHSKGGVGKSLTAYQLIGKIHHNCVNYLAIDCDVDNRTISTINDYIRKDEKLNIKVATSAETLEKIIKENQDQRIIIIDTGGNSNTITQKAMQLATKIITPISNDSVTEAVGFTRFKSLLSHIGNPKINIMFTNVNSRAKNFEDMKKVLNTYGNLSFMKNGLKTRSIYKIATSRGLSVAELKPTNNKVFNSQLSKAKEELLHLYEEVLL